MCVFPYGGTTTKVTPTQLFCCEHCNVFKNSFFMEHLQWLLLQVLYKKAVPKCFSNFTRTYRYQSSFQSSWRPRTCNFIKIEGLVQVFSCEFSEISQNNIM